MDKLDNGHHNEGERNVRRSKSPAAPRSDNHREATHLNKRESSGGRQQKNDGTDIHLNNTSNDDRRHQNESNHNRHNDDDRRETGSNRNHDHDQRGRARRRKRSLTSEEKEEDDEREAGDGMTENGNGAHTEKNRNDHNNERDVRIPITPSKDTDADAEGSLVEGDDYYDEESDMLNHDWPLSEDKDGNPITNNNPMNRGMSTRSRKDIEEQAKLPDWNTYQQKKTLASGMMDLALLSANANQLRYVLETPSDTQGGFFYISLFCISLSIILQIAVGILLIWNSRYNIRKHKHVHMADQVNNYTLIGIFLITICNVFISAFGIPSPATASSGPVLSSSPQVQFRSSNFDMDLNQTTDSTLQIL